MRLAVAPCGLRWCPVERARRRPPQEVGGRGKHPVRPRDLRACRLRRVQAALLLPANPTPRGIRIRRRCREENPPLTPGQHCLGTSKAREQCGFLRAGDAVEEDRRSTRAGQRLDFFFLNSPLVQWAMRERPHLALRGSRASLRSDHGPVVLMRRKQGDRLRIVMLSMTVEDIP